MMIDLTLKDKYKVAQKIYENTQEQTKVIAREDEGSLLHLLDERQGLLDELATISKGIQGKEEEEIQKEIQTILQKAYNQEMENQKKVEELKGKLYQEIQEFQYGQKAMTEGYRKQQASTYGYFIDKKN